jgi:dolichol-phosphate mannosyltransferase
LLAAQITAPIPRMRVLDAQYLKVLFPILPLFRERRCTVADLHPLAGTVVAQAGVGHVAQVLITGHRPSAKRGGLDGTEQVRFAPWLDTCCDKVAHDDIVSTMPEVAISIIIPTLNEAANLPLLVPQIAHALSGRDYEILIIDDNSRDETPQVCADLSQEYPLRLIVREEPSAGLGGAVLHGLRMASGAVFVVMDADLQHPPQKIPQLLEPLERGEADFALGSRYVRGGSMAEKWGPMRRLNSRIATLLARPFAGTALDPMSGFFAVRRDTFERAERLTPLGYKIGLELMCKCRVQRVAEVPIHFAERTAGRSKLSLREQFRYLEHLSRLYDFCYPHLSPIAKFLIVLALSWLVGLAVFQLLLLAEVRPSLAPPIAYLAGIGVTGVFHLRYIRTQREFLLTRHPWREFVMVAMAELIVCTFVGIWVVTRLDPARAWEVFLFPFAAATIVRYVLRKELMLDIRGLRRELRREELGFTAPAPQATASSSAQASVAGQLQRDEHDPPSPVAKAQP